MSNIFSNPHRTFIVIYTKENGRQELTQEEWNAAQRLDLTYHREDGPAFEFWFGTKYWYIDGRCHRTDGPARRYGNDGVVSNSIEDSLITNTKKEVQNV